MKLSRILSFFRRKKIESIVYSDGKDYSHLRKSAYYKDPEYECNECGSTLVTELNDKDICHDCGFIYT